MEFHIGHRQNLRKGPAGGQRLAGEKGAKKWALPPLFCYYIMEGEDMQTFC